MRSQSVANYRANPQIHKEENTKPARSIPKREQRELKLVVAGAPDVGRKTFVMKFVHGGFNDPIDSTQGAAYLTKTHTYGNGKSVKYEVYFARYAVVEYCWPREVQEHCCDILPR